MVLKMTPFPPASLAPFAASSENRPLQSLLHAALRGWVLAHRHQQQRVNSVAVLSQSWFFCRSVNALPDAKPARQSSSKLAGLRFVVADRDYDLAVDIACP